MDLRTLRATWRAAFERWRLRAARALGPLARRALPSESQHLFAVTLLVGVVCGLVAVAFHLSIRATEALLINRALHAGGSSWVAWTLVTPTLGGLVAGAALYWVVPGARGSGIPQVKQAFALEGGRVRFRDAFGKFWLAVLQIGSGASLGREGPTVQICAGAASGVARATALPARNFRRLIPVGVAAGIAAAFNAPIAAVTFTIEEIVGALDNAVLSGVVVAAALAAVIERSVLGVHPIIEVEQQYGLEHASSLLIYALLGVAAAGVSVLFTDSLLGLRARFRTLTAVPKWAHPAVGGLVTGALAVVALSALGTEGVTGGGYETLGRALAGRLELKVLLALCGLKLVATVFSYSSGGAGGIFAPSLFVGAMLGGAVGYVDVALFEHAPSNLGAFALVGMGAVFAGVVRAPMTSVLIIFEMTGGYGLVLPLMLANMTAYVLARRARPTPIYEALLEQDGVVLPRPGGRTHALERLTAREAMTADVVTASAEATVEATLSALGERPFALFPVVGADGTLKGAVTLPALRAAAGGGRGAQAVAMLATPCPVARAGSPLSRVVVKMSDARARQILVVDDDTGARLLGLIAISDVVRAHAHAARPGQSTETAPALEGPAATASSLARAAGSVSPSMTADELVRVLPESPSRAALVRSAEGLVTGVVVLEQLHALLSDEALQAVLVAADVAGPAVEVEPDASVEDVARQLWTSGAEAAHLRGEPERVITRAMTATAIFEWLSRRSADA